MKKELSTHNRKCYVKLGHKIVKSLCYIYMLSFLGNKMYVGGLKVFLLTGPCGKKLFLVSKSDLMDSFTLVFHNNFYFLQAHDNLLKKIERLVMQKWVF